MKVKELIVWIIGVFLLVSCNTTSMSTGNVISQDEHFTQINSGDEKYFNHFSKYMLFKTKDYLRVKTSDGKLLYEIPHSELGLEQSNIYYVSSESLYTASETSQNIIINQFTIQNGKDLNRTTFNVIAPYSKLLDITVYNGHTFITGYNRNYKMTVIKVNKNSPNYLYKVSATRSELQNEQIRFIEWNNKLLLQMNSNKFFTLNDEKDRWESTNMIPPILTDLRDNKRMTYELPKRCVNSYQINAGNSITKIESPSKKVGFLPDQKNTTVEFADCIGKKALFSIGKGEDLSYVVLGLDGGQDVDIQGEQPLFYKEGGIVSFKDNDLYLQYFNEDNTTYRFHYPVKEIVVIDDKLLIIDKAGNVFTK